MAGVGTFLKQTRKLQEKIGAMQEELKGRVLEVSAGGGAVTVKISGGGDLVGLEINGEFLKEDAKVVSETVLGAVKEAMQKAKDLGDEEMKKVMAASGLPAGMPGLF